MYYRNLLEQYKLLTDEEKNILLIYKSYLFHFINNLDDINNNIQKYYNDFENYKRIINLQSNLFIKNSVFKNINFDSFDKFIIDINSVYKKLNELFYKIKLPSDKKLYRATSINNLNEINNISKGNFISTSLSLEVTDSFYDYNNNIDVLYQIDAHENMPCLIIPYAIKKNDKEQLKIVEGDNQLEVVLSKQLLDFNMISQKQVEDERTTIICKIIANQKNIGEKSK